MRAFFVAEKSAGRRPPEGIPEAGLEVEPISGPADLAEALLAIERRLAAAEEAAVVLGDASDLSLAAALVAANGRLIAQIAAATLDDESSQIAAWARSAGAASPLTSP